MKIHDLKQGSDAWAAFRLEHFGASEAAAMLGVSSKMKRNELLHAKHTGLAREFSDFVQTRILDKGHEVEALARPLVEALIGDDLYPVTCSEGKLSASCDGLTLGQETAFEHKLWNPELAESVRAGVVPDEHLPQCHQLLMVTGAERVIFVVSDGTPERMVHTYVTPDPQWANRIVDGWAQFEKDLAAYTPPADAAPMPAGKAPETLPALRIEVTGMVTASNLAEFKQTALAAIRSVNRELSTDTDFANAEAAVKWCGEVETRLAAAKDHALSQTASIDTLFRTIDAISAEARQVRLELDKLVKHRKESIRGEIVAGAVAVLDKHLRELNAALGEAYMPRIPADFAGVIKGKRTVTSLRDAVDTELARAKIEANAVYQRITVNMKTLVAAGDSAAFPDAATLVLKAPDDLAAIIAQRAAEAQRRLDAERERIRAEEQAKAQREAEQAARIAQPAPVAAPAPAAPAVVAFVQRAPASDPPTLTLGAINARFGPGFTMSSAFISESLGMNPAATDKAAKLYRESQWPAICEALVRHVGAVRELRAA